MQENDGLGWKMEKVATWRKMSGDEDFPSFMKEDYIGRERFCVSDFQMLRIVKI